MGFGFELDTAYRDPIHYSESCLSCFDWRPVRCLEWTEAGGSLYRVVGGWIKRCDFGEWFTEMFHWFMW